MTKKAQELTIQLVEELEKTQDPKLPAKETRRYKFRYGFNREILHYKGETLKVDFGAYFYPNEIERRKQKIAQLQAEIAAVEAEGTA